MNNTSKIFKLGYNVSTLSGCKNNICDALQRALIGAYIYLDATYSQADAVVQRLERPSRDAWPVQKRAQEPVDDQQAHGRLEIERHT